MIRRNGNYDATDWKLYATIDSDSEQLTAIIVTVIDLASSYLESKTQLDLGLSDF